MSMAEYDIDLADVINHIDPASLSYEDWVKIGMGLKEAGYPVSLWDSWSRRDGRYHHGECERKWNSFNGSSAPVTGGTIVAMAMENGWMPDQEGIGYAIGWDDEITPTGVIDTAWVENKDVFEPADWNPIKEMIRYLETLFSVEDFVGYVTQSFEKEGRHLPSKGNYKRTAGELIEGLSNCKGDPGAVLGDYTPNAGAWIRFNPLDGKGVGNVNVAEFRYALVECDDLEIEKQNALIRELELPVATLTYSGNKSLHAIVRIDAKDYDEYKKRVDFLYKTCKRNGLTIDGQNKNPSRLSRFPGFTRGEQKQFLLDTNIGKKSWTEWEAWIQDESDTLPDVTSFDNEIDLDLPENPCIIDGMLRPGDKMMMSGPSKAGKSYALLELAIAIAEGQEWLGMQCTPGNVLYVNFELRRDDRIKRMKTIYDALHQSINNGERLLTLDLKGQAAPIEVLKNKLVRSVTKHRPVAIILDPIYKIMMGDENNAADVSEFCNVLDFISVNTGAAIVYCHHHSKGSQDKKQSMDRASGSGVFARDVDVLLDMTELFVDDNIRSALREKNEHMTAWRIETTLREFAPKKPFYISFSFPLHKVDDSGILSDISIKKKNGNNAESKVQSAKWALDRNEKLKLVRTAISALKESGEKYNYQNIAEFIDSYESKNVTARTVKGWVAKFKSNSEADFIVEKDNDFQLEEIPY